ncbi:MAG: hypothetical protein EOP22_02495 [Hyphomicrobiales bacterium]|nr:MAG: hypothetical protein EOP22_02495 [Hyphomicrobiales bacterium]
MNRLAASAGLVAMAVLTIAPSYAADRVQSDAALKRGLVGCWERSPNAAMQQRLKDPNFYNSHQRCFDGPHSNVATYSTCDGYMGFDCWEGRFFYSVSNGRLMFSDHAAGWRESCVAEVSDTTISLDNCIQAYELDAHWKIVPSADASYRKVQQ